MRKTMIGTASALALCLAGLSNGHAMDKAAADKETATAKAIVAQAGEDLKNIAMLCQPPKDQIAMLQTFPDPKPTKVFDNLYFVGRGSVSSWAITTSAGIILIDTLDNSQEADDFIIGGLKKLGLDPNSIKYIVVTHGHGDHYGGAHELQAKIPGVHVLMTQTDYDMADKAAAAGGGAFKDVPAPTHDMVVKDGQKLTLGDETITLYITPGHTPGTISAIIPVKDHGQAHLMGLFGGSTFPLDKKIIAQFGDSLKRFRGIMAGNQVVGRLSNHAIWDGSIAKLKQINANPNGPNPYLESPADMTRYAQIQDHCMQAQLDLLP